MLSGLRFEKKEKEEKDDKKSKDKKRKKELKKAKKREKKDKKGKKEASSSSNSDEPAVVVAPDAAATSAPKIRSLSPIGGKAQEEPPAHEAPPKKPDAEEDFFSKRELFPTHIPKSQKMKANPEHTKVVHDKELNLLLKGGELTQAVPDSGTTGIVPKTLTVGDGGRAWRNRAKKRAEQAAREEAGEAPAPIMKRLGGESAPPAQAGKESAKASGKGSVHKGSRSRDRSKSAGRGRRERSKSAGRGRSRSRPRKRDRSSPSPQRKNSQRSRSRSRKRSRSKSAEHGATERLRGRGSNAAGDWCNRNEKILQERAKEAAEDDTDAVLRKIQSKYSGGSASNAPLAPASAPQDIEEPEDGNELAALAMQAMLSGDMERYEELNRRLEKKQAQTAKAQEGVIPTAAAERPVRGKNGERVAVIEEVDASGRSRALVESVQSASVGLGQRGAKKLKGFANVGPEGKGKVKEEGFFADDNISLDDLIRREKIEGVQDYDANFANNIVNDKKYKQLHDDDDEAYMLGHYEDRAKKTDAAKLAARQQRQQVSEKQNIAKNLERCNHCMESKRFRLHDSIISKSTHAYVVMADIKDSIMPNQVVIHPQEHMPAMTDLDDSAYTEIRNYQKCLVRFYEAQDPPQTVIFAETCISRPDKDKVLMGAGPHASVVAYPIDLDVFSQARSFFKKAFDEAEDEWSTQHKKVIETTAKGGVRAAIPKNFPYIHVDFALGGGYAHIVEDAAEFPQKFAQNTIAGMCELTVLDRAYPAKDQWKEALQAMKQKFQKEFDWTQAVQ